MKTLYNFVLVLLSVISFCSCTKLGLDVSFEPGKYSFTGRGGIISIPIHVSSDWNVSSDGDWITFEQNHGDASSQCINVICDVNRSTSGPRYANVTLRSGMSKDVIRIAQGIGFTYVATYYGLNQDFMELNGLTNVLKNPIHWGNNVYEHEGALVELRGVYRSSDIKMIDIPSTVSVIRNGGIGSNLKVIVCRAIKAPQLIGYPFIKSQPITLYVPEGSDYSSWKEYFDNVTIKTLKDPSDIGFGYDYKGEAML